MKDVEANRLTDSDRNAITARVTEVLKMWRHNAPFGRMPSICSSDIVALERTAYHSIGCNVHDLRDSELEEIEATVNRLAATLGTVAA